MSKRPCPRDSGAGSAALASGAETELRDAASWGGEAGLVTRLWVHVNSVGRRSPALPPPNHRSPQAGGGRAGSWPLPSAPATTAPPLALAPALTRAPTPPGGAGGSRSLLRACGFCPLSLCGGKCTRSGLRGKPHEPGMEPSSGHPLVGVPHRSPEQCLRRIKPSPLLTALFLTWPF